MARHEHELTAREKAGLFYLASGVIKDWRTAYIISRDKPQADVAAQPGIDSSIARWKHRADVSNQYDIFCRYFADRDADNRKRGADIARAEMDSKGQEEEGGRIDTKSTRGRSFVDYSSPDNQTQKLNELVNTAEDPGEVLDALKVIIQTQRADREGAKDNKTVRAYLPLTCQECPLYHAAREKGKNR